MKTVKTLYVLLYLVLTSFVTGDSHAQTQEYNYFVSTLQITNAHTVFIASEEKDEVIYSVGVRVYDDESEVMFLVTHNFSGEQLNYSEFDNTPTSKGMRTADLMLITGNEILVVYNRGLFALNTGVLTMTSLDLEGNVNWTKQYGEQGVREALEVAQDEEGNFYIAGWEQLTWPMIMSSRGFLQKRDSEGELIWHKTFEEAVENRTKLNAVKIIDGALWLGGVIEEVASNGGEFDNYLVVADFDGNKTDSFVWGTQDNDSGTIPFVFDGKIFISTVRHTFGEATNYTIWKFGESNLLESQTELDLEMTTLWGVASPYAIFENVFFARANKWIENVGYVERIANFDSALDTLWIQDLLIDGLSNPISRDLNLLSDGSLLLTGFNFAGEGETQMGWLIKMDTLAQTCSYLGCDSTVIDTSTHSEYFNSFVTGDYYLSLSPNPLMGSTVNLRYSLPHENPQAWWYVYNLNGQLLRSRKLSTSEYSRKIDLGNIPTGTYLWDLNIGNKKMTSGKFQVIE